jgi:hypothetical protein
MQLMRMMVIPSAVKDRVGLHSIIGVETQA